MVLPVGLLNIVFWATVAIWIRSAYGQNCHRYNVSRIAVVEPSSYYSDMYYFSCADGEFFTSVDVWYGNSVDELRWICSDGDTSYYPDDTSDYPNNSWVTFDVGIAAVEASFISWSYDDSSDSYVILGDSYIGGYNLSSSASTSDGVIFEWSGPFGTGDDYTTDTWTSSCPADSYVTGATWWISSNFGSLMGIQLECADVTSTCYPPDLPNQGDDDLGSTSTTDDDLTEQDCDRFNVSRIPIIEPGSYPMMYYFSCGNGAFFTSVDVWHGNSVDELRWRCSDGDTSYYPEDTSDYNYSWVTFDVGITAVEASFISGLYDDSSDTEVFLGDSYIGGYNLAPSTSTSDGVIFEWSGPFGTGDTYTTDTWTSSCPVDSYATGATWWIYPGSGSLNGIQLECANVTSTCYPPDLPNQDDSTTISRTDDDPTSTDDTTTISGTGDDPTSTDEDDVTDDDDSMVTIIAVSVSATAAVVAVVVGTCVWCFFRSRHRVSEQPPSLPVRMTTPEPSCPEFASLLYIGDGILFVRRFDLLMGTLMLDHNLCSYFNLCWYEPFTHEDGVAAVITVSSTTLYTTNQQNVQSGYLNERSKI